ncbi:hypothetical protein HPB48_026135 [Haemaphysalis longicornis]|uniref:Transposable element P transposase-like RNase H domain-containing protein n=1 Tax=Haemaphysalis longicornis TaxID=44386 RepID=A0A9J6H8S8_HAELO|nr:hypothetical protein HPB48_026135 [Haemaphysalis longicornis]
MVRPDRTCLTEYIQRFKGGFVLSPKVFAALSGNTKGMDVFSRHGGGLVIDYVKLSEDLDVKSNGAIEGFVDLGEHTSPDQKGVLADHGIIVMFQPFVGNQHFYIIYGDIVLNLIFWHDIKLSVKETT